MLGGSEGAGENSLRPWETIESDPDVFWGLCQAIGAKKLDFVELWDLDPNSNQPGSLPHLVKEYGKVLGLIFLFRWHPSVAEVLKKAGTIVPLDNCKELFFAPQVAKNSCATVALMNVIMNLGKDDVEMGGELMALKSFCDELPPEVIGEVIGTHPLLEVEHNSSVSRAFSGMITEPEDSKDDKNTEPAFHYLAFVPRNGNTYLNDGLSMPGPVLLSTDQGQDAPAASETQDWTQQTIKPIQAVIQQLQESVPNDIRFNLIAMVPDPSVKLQQNLQSLQQKIAEHLLKLKELSSSPSAASKEDEITVERKAIKQCLEDTGRIRELLEEIKQRNQERSRRRDITSSDLVPFLFGVLRLLAKKGELSKAYDRARAAMQNQQTQ